MSAPQTRQKLFLNGAPTIVLCAADADAWPETAKALSILSREIDRMAPAFEHPEPMRAPALETTRIPVNAPPTAKPAKTQAGENKPQKCAKAKRRRCGVEM